MLLFSGGAYVVFPKLFSYVSETIDEVMYSTRITEGFVTRLRVSFLIGLLFSLPALLFQIVLFLFPALKTKEKGFLLGTLICTFLLFLGGVYFAYGTVLPISIAFLKSREFYPEDVGRLISYQYYVTFFFQFLLGFGLCFQFPVAITLLVRWGFVSVGKLVRFFKYFVITAVVISAIITPPDIVSQIMLTVPMLILYGLCIPIGLVVRPKEKALEAKETRCSV
jgi:sec-independent protein translocase protein TatC